ncbi:MucBP domain-containing protein, partial [Dellaglioa carnosa]|uniref:MucBP domain-containing protein n=1 Tax=Dellaglioa carnosa TaxID=2995136 RepID=UPI0022A8A8E2
LDAKGGEVTYVYTKSKASDITVNYEDEAGKKLADSETITGKIDDPYKTEKKDITNYTFLKMKDGSLAAEGKLDAKGGEVTYVYVKDPEPIITGTVTAKYVDETG